MTDNSAMYRGSPHLREIAETIVKWDELKIDYHKIDDNWVAPTINTSGKWGTPSTSGKNSQTQSETNSNESSVQNSPKLAGSKNFEFSLSDTIPDITSAAKLTSHGASGSVNPSSPPAEVAAKPTNNQQQTNSPTP